MFKLRKTLTFMQLISAFHLVGRVSHNILVNITSSTKASTSKIFLSRGGSITMKMTIMSSEQKLHSLCVME